jgi:hypothetical protein
LEGIDESSDHITPPEMRAIRFAGTLSYIINSKTVEEMVLESGGVSAESPSSGFAANAVPKEGGNAHSMTVFGLFTNDNLQASNVSDELLARNVTTTDSTVHVYDSGVTLGGPVKKDKAWYFSSLRWQGSKNLKSGIFYNTTTGTPFYTPDPNRPADRREYDRFYSGRVTWQASPRNKVNFFADLQDVCQCAREGFTAPEATFGLHFWPQRLFQVTWSSPRSNRLVLDAGVSAVISDWADMVQEGATTKSISILETSTSFMYNANNLRYIRHIDDDHLTQRFSLSYVTGSHVFKTGIQIEELTYNQLNDVNEKTGFGGRLSATCRTDS